MCKPAPTCTWRPQLPQSGPRVSPRTAGHEFFCATGANQANHAGIQGTRYGPLQSLGDLSDEKVKRDVEAVMKDAIGFFAKCVLA